MSMPGQPGPSSVGGILEAIAKLPSPEKLFTEFQRLNTNLEKLQAGQILAELQRLNNNLDKLQLYPADIRNLSQAIQSARTGELLQELKRFNTNIEKFHNKLWRD